MVVLPSALRKCPLESSAGRPAEAGRPCRTQPGSVHRGADRFRGDFDRGMERILDKNSPARPVRFWPWSTPCSQRSSCRYRPTFQEDRGWARHAVLGRAAGRPRAEGSPGARRTASRAASARDRLSHLAGPRSAGARVRAAPGRGRVGWDCSRIGSLRARVRARPRPRPSRRPGLAPRPADRGDLRRPGDQRLLPRAGHVPRQRHPQLLRPRPRAAPPRRPLALSAVRRPVRALRRRARDGDLVWRRVDGAAERPAGKGRPAGRSGSAPTTTVTTSSTAPRASRFAPIWSPATSPRARPRPIRTATPSTTRGRATTCCAWSRSIAPGRSCSGS